MGAHNTLQDNQLANKNQKLLKNGRLYSNEQILGHVNEKALEPANAQPPPPYPEPTGL